MGAATTPAAWLNPDVFIGRGSLSAFEPYPIVSGTAWSSNAPGSAVVVPFLAPNNVGVKNIVQLASWNAAVPAATSQASSGSEGFTYAATAALYSRQDYGANSTNLTALATASGGLTASMSYTSTSQLFGLTWATDSTGGTSTFTTTSNSGNWSNFATGAKFFSIPFATNLSGGEYWLAFQYSSTSATSNSNVTLLSFSQFQQNWPVISMGSIAGSASLAASGPDGMAIGIASALTTNNTMAGSVVSAATQNIIYFALSNV